MHAPQIAGQWPRATAALLLVSAMTLTGCGKKAPEKGPDKTTATAADKGAKATPLAKAATPVTTKKEKQKVLLWHAYRDAERAALDKLIKAWNNSHSDIELVALAVPFDALIDKAQVAIPRGNGPDLLIFAHDKVGTWARDGLIAPLGSWASKARLKRFLPQTIKPLVFERAIYGLPLAFKSLVLFYNRTMIAKPPATMAELVALAKKHTDKT